MAIVEMIESDDGGGLGLPLKPTYYTMKEAGVAVRCHRRTIYREVKRLSLPLLHIGKKTLIHRDVLLQIIKEREP